MAINKPYESMYLNKIKTPQKGSAEYGKVEKDASQEYLDRLKAIDTRMRQTQALRDTDMGNIRRNANLAQENLNDKMFQEYLSNRERMGGRGVANSGLMADAQIRLNANKQDRLAELYGQTQDKLSEVNRMYAPQQTELLAERQGTRQSKIFQEMFDKVLENRAREAQMLSPLMQNEFTAGESATNRTFTTSEREAGEKFTEGQNILNRKQEKELSQAEINAKKELQAAEIAAANARAEADRLAAKDSMEYEKQAALDDKNKDKVKGYAESWGAKAELHSKNMEDAKAMLMQPNNDDGTPALSPAERKQWETTYRIESFKKEKAIAIAGQIMKSGSTNPSYYRPVWNEYNNVNPSWFN